MKILVIGSFTVENSTNIFAAKALRELGHEVIEFDYRLVSSQIGPTAMNAGILYETNKSHPDLVIICKGDVLAVSVVQQLAKITHVHYWYPDPICTTPQHFIQLASECTTVSCCGGGVARFFVDKGCPKVFHILEGVDPSYYHPIGSSPDFSAEVSFIGSRTQEKMDYIYYLGAKHLVRVYGPGFGNQIFGDTFSVVCGSSKAMLSVNTENTTADSFSDRVFLYLACGSFVFQKYSPGLENVFENKKHLVWFDSKEELLDLADYYLVPEREEERRAIAQAGYEKVITNHTWRHSMLQLLECIK